MSAGTLYLDVGHMRAADSIGRKSFVSATVRLSDQSGKTMVISTVPNDIGGVEHDALDLLDDDLYAVPDFTGRPMPKSPARKGQQKASRLKSPRNSESPREKPQKPETFDFTQRKSGSETKWCKERPLQTLGKYGSM
eukprot:4969013-Amphidinium_carterae.2